MNGDGQHSGSSIGGAARTYKTTLREQIATLMHKQRQRTIRRLPMPAVKEVYKKDRCVAELVSTDFDCLPANHDYRQIALDEADEVLFLLEDLGLLDGGKR